MKSVDISAVWWYHSDVGSANVGSRPMVGQAILLWRPAAGAFCRKGWWRDTSL